MVIARQFDVFRNPNARSSRFVPWLLVLQSDLLQEFPTRIVAPLVRPNELRVPAARLNPTFDLGEEKAVMLTQQVGAVRSSSLRLRVASLADQRQKIIAAVDFLLGGV